MCLLFSVITLFSCLDVAHWPDTKCLLKMYPSVTVYITNISFIFLSASIGLGSGLGQIHYILYSKLDDDDKPDLQTLLSEWLRLSWYTGSGFNKDISHHESTLVV